MKVSEHILACLGFLEELMGWKLMDDMRVADSQNENLFVENAAMNGTETENGTQLNIHFRCLLFHGLLHSLGRPSE